MSHMRFFARIAASTGASTTALLLLAALTVMPAACTSEPDYLQRRAPNGGEDEPANPNGPGGGGYDPEAPTNQGPEHNPNAYAAVSPLFQRSCTECHHAGTWLDLTKGADSATASLIVKELEKGSMPPAPRVPLTADELAKVKAWKDGQAVPPVAIDLEPPNLNATQILDATTLATYRAALPKVGYERLDKILKSNATLFWDKATMPPAYQDVVGDGGGLPFGARLNSTGRSLIVPEGKKLFSEDGKSWSFPFGHTAGTDDSTNAFIVNFMSLPAENGKLLPVVYRVETGTKQSFPIKRWNWSYPRGTVVGEIILVKDGTKLVTTEIRMRERYADKWATNVFRPFPTAKSLASALKQKNPSFATVPALKSAVDALENNTTLTAKKIGSPAFSNLVALEGAVDAPLPDLGDDALVRDLLQTTTFVSAYGTAWKTNGTQKAFGATGSTSAKLSLTPNRFDTGLLEVRETTCEKCHNQGGYFIGDLVDAAVLYGDVWGVDRIFSFHPFDPSRIDASGNENRVVRPAFASAGMVVRYDAAQHPATRYTFYSPQP